MFDRLNNKLQNGERIAGAYIFGGLPIMTEAMAQCGFDVLWIDMEHTSIGIESLTNNLIAARAGGTPSWVRIPWNDPVLAKPVLDVGADGIIFPYVCTAEEARQAVQACAYPPEGIRGYGPLRALNYGGITQMEYVTETFRNCHRVIQIEHIDAVRDLKRIVTIEEIDAYIIGPMDLSASLGKLGKLDDPELCALFEEIVAVVHGAGKPVGVSYGMCSREEIAKWRDRGVDMISLASETDFIITQAGLVLEDMKAVMLQ